MGINIYYLAAIIIWTIPWKGFALWKSARRGEVVWFVILLILNTAGIVEILYLFFFSNTPKIQPNRERFFERNPY